MASVAVYVVMHKPYRTPADGAYVPIQVGGAEDFSDLRDNTGENIAEKNPSFCELTALYWMWKNAPEAVLGLAHYRRHFAGSRGRDPWARVLTAEQALAYLQQADILLPKKRHYYIETNYSQYAHAHYEKDLKHTRQVLGELCPDYVSAFDEVMARRSGHRFNMFLARREVMDRYCSWLFPILFRLEKVIDTTGYDVYNRRVIGFLAERLLDVWLQREILTVREVSVVNMEGENWLRKGFLFLGRKLKGASK